MVKNFQRVGLIGGSALAILFAFGMGLLIADLGEANQGEWLSFAGALLGTALTVGGSIGVLEWQGNSEVRSRKQLLIELLNDVDRECVPFQCANDTALRARSGFSTGEQVDRLKSAIARIHKFREKMLPETAQMMRVGDVLSPLSIQDAEVEGWITSIRFYPDSADLGGLNAIGHRIQGIVDEALKMMK